MGKLIRFEIDYSKYICFVYLFLNALTRLDDPLPADADLAARHYIFYFRKWKDFQEDVIRAFNQREENYTNNPLTVTPLKNMKLIEFFSLSTPILYDYD